LTSTQLSDLCTRVTLCIAILYSGRPLIIGDQLSKVDAFIAGCCPGWP
jgi:beta-glucosidase